MHMIWCKSRADGKVRMKEGDDATRAGLVCLNAPELCSGVFYQATSPIRSPVSPPRRLALNESEGSLCEAFLLQKVRIPTESGTCLPNVTDL
jgi:hypothetical protein